MVTTAWEPAARVQKNDAGEFRALIGNEWVPVEKAQKNDSGEFRVMRFAAPEPAPVATQPPPVQKKPEGGLLSTLKELAAPYASTLDVTVGGVIPAVVGQVTYPVVRTFSTPEQAQQVTAGITGAIDRPFGRALGVTEWPEYQGDVTRRILGAVGDVVQSGVNRVASATGLPASDVSSLVGWAALMVPGAARAGVNALREVPAVQAAEGAVRESVNKLREPARQKASEAAYARGAQIDAAKEAQRLGIAIDPRDLNPDSRTAKIRVMRAGERAVPEIQKVNVANVRQVMLDDLNLPKETDFTKPETFDKARAALSKPYNEIARLPTVVADADTLERIQKLMPEGHIIGKEAREAAIGRVVESADRLMTEGLTGRQILDNISNLRKEARKVYDAKSPDLAAMEAADTKLAIANILEGVVEKNIPDPGLLKEFRAARAGMARTYAYEGAVNKNTGMLEVDRLARITSKDNSYTGRLASLGQIAGNFPYAFSNNPSIGGSTLTSNSLGRGSLGGSAAATVAYASGGYQAAVPASIGGGIADMIGRGRAARKIASREYQSKRFIPDARIRKIEPDAPQNLGPTVARGREIVPYVITNPEVLDAPSSTSRDRRAAGDNKNSLVKGRSRNALR